ncbi:hypothetical protein XPR_2636 [Xanthomonas arboricola pv. pruni MAFF 301420]|uniref:Multidrug resistance protein MdtA-like barrel-sandwich hybrid domain-containing protein n=1 Tax=Xanthomonas arboricola pv. pruni MAFF 301420 TaxID=1418095 RepID=W4SHL1_9XANT|nr:hypothetical protein XPR_2636 [Xanthomonas arboricola pv. pruni MAFF 301420]
MLRRLVTSAAFCVLPLALIACGKAPPSDPRTAAPLVRVAIVEDAGAAARSFSGTVAARVQSDLGFRVAGKVQERLVDAGQRVKRGQPLLRIDPADLKLAARAQQYAGWRPRRRAPSRRVRMKRATAICAAPAPSPPRPTTRSRPPPTPPGRS